jgi:hypothetical protein
MQVHKNILVTGRMSRRLASASALRGTALIVSDTPARDRAVEGGAVLPAAAQIILAADRARLHAIVLFRMVRCDLSSMARNMATMA